MGLARQVPDILIDPVESRSVRRYLVMAREGYEMERGAI